MRLVVEATDVLVELDGVPCRVWRTDRAGVLLYVHRVAVDERAVESLASELLAEMAYDMAGEVDGPGCGQD